MLRARLFAFIFAASAATPAAPEDVIKIIAALERDWAAAAVSKELPTLDRLLHERFRLVPLYAPSLGVTERAEYLEYQRANPLWGFRAMTPISIEVEPRGNIAISTVEMQVGWPEGTPAQTAYRFTDVWVLRDGLWRVISRFSEHRPP